MAYSADQWTEARLLFESGVSLGKIIARENIKIKSKGAISKRATAEGWKVNGRKAFISQEVLTKQALSDIAEKKETLSPLERSVHDSLVAEKLKNKIFFDNAHIQIAEVTVAKVKAEGEAASFQDLNAAANTITKAREGVLGKAPDTLINNMNAQQNVLPLTQTPEQVRLVREMLDSHL